jgi:hypothetical protein
MAAIRMKVNPAQNESYRSVLLRIKILSEYRFIALTVEYHPIKKPNRMFKTGTPMPIPVKITSTAIKIIINMNMLSLKNFISLSLQIIYEAVFTIVVALLYYIYNHKYR